MGGPQCAIVSAVAFCISNFDVIILLPGKKGGGAGNQKKLNTPLFIAIGLYVAMVASNQVRNTAV